MGSVIIDGSAAASPASLTSVPSLTVDQVITRALEEIGVLYPGEPPSSDDLLTGIVHLNRLVTSNNLMKSSIFTVTKTDFTLTANKQTYTWGIDPDGILTADIALQRPTGIQNLVLQYSSTPTIVRQPPMRRLNDMEWASKLIPGISAIPYEYYNDGAYPLSTLYLFPAPNSAYVVELWYWQMGARFSSGADLVVYPDGYEDFWHYNLAHRLCGPFRKAFTEAQTAEWAAANRRISEANNTPGHIVYDPALTSGGRYGYFSWVRGPYK